MFMRKRNYVNDKLCKLAKARFGHVGQGQELDNMEISYKAKERKSKLSSLNRQKFNFNLIHNCCKIINL